MDSSNQQSQRRRAERHAPFSVCPVNDGSDRPLGHLVDVSESGAMLITPREPREGEGLELRVPEGTDLPTFRASGTVVWTKPTASEGYAVVGIRFDGSLTPHQARLLRQLIERTCL